jgi:hypothetical protein
MPVPAPVIRIVLPISRLPRGLGPGRSG